MQQVKQSEATSARRRVMLLALDATDGYTPETGLTIAASELRVSKNGGTEANALGSFVEIGGGLYYYVADASELDTLGVVTFRLNKSGVRGSVSAVQVVSFDPYSATSLGLTNLTNAVLSADATADAVLDRSAGVETGLTVRQWLRLTGAALIGKVSGVGSGTLSFRNAVADSKVRVTSTVDSNGNRTAVSTDAT